jgi:glycosyltransferase involved in cell wall biosynthesis
MEYNFITKRTALVVTPSIGSQKLIDAIKSVQEQDYLHTEHLIVADGFEHSQEVKKIVGEVIDRIPNRAVYVMAIPFNTGANGFYGHRIYASIAHLVNSDYVTFLDEDNWYEPNHISSLVEIQQKTKSDFVYSLRNVWDADKKNHVEDRCESLGFMPVWPSVGEGKVPSYHVDTSSYLFNREWLLQYGHIWHWGWGADRRFFQIATAQTGANAKYTSSFKHTLNYRLDGNPNSVGMDFFIQGNEFMKKHFKEDIWSKI